MSVSHYYPVILAGGYGTRLWPVSRASLPKQLSLTLGGMTLLEHAYRNVRKGFSRDAVFVSTNSAAVPIVRRMLPDLPRQNIVAEPVKRDTAPAVGLAALELLRRDPMAVMVTVNSDAWVGDTTAFLDVLRFSHRAAAAQPGHLVFVGIPPTYPETGYGYLEMGKPVMKHGGYEAFELRSFTEKPSLAVARKYLKLRRYLWNPSLMTARADTLMRLYEKYLPGVARGLMRIARFKRVRQGAASVQRAFRRLPSISIDYGIFEKLAGNMLVIPAEFGWADVGSFRTVHDILSRQKCSNIAPGPLIAIDAENNMVMPEREKLVALIGVNNVIMIETEDAILLCHRERAQEVRKAVDLLKKKGLGKYV